MRRGPLVESRHRVHAAVVRDGELVDGRGDARLVTFMRSAAKPFQALPLVRAYEDLADEEVALASASHHARPEQLEPVRSLLARAGADESDLECGPVEGSRLRHNCSGKHAGFLCVCAARGWEQRGYHRSEHPVQSLLLGIVADAAGVQIDSLAIGIDGCGVATFGLPLDRMAHAYSRLVLAELQGARRVVGAMTAGPELVEGAGSPATEVMRALPGAVAKGGAEGVLCIGLQDGTGVALKVEDGAARATGPAAAALLDLPALAELPVRNSRGEQVGAVASI